jgi:hypothetical protein
MDASILTIEGDFQGGKRYTLALQYAIVRVAIVRNWDFAKNSDSIRHSVTKLNFIF